MHSWPEFSAAAGCGSATGSGRRPAPRLNCGSRSGALVDGLRRPTLVTLEERAVRSNLDLMLAEARIRQARAARGIAVSGLGPPWTPRDLAAQPVSGQKRQLAGRRDPRGGLQHLRRRLRCRLGAGHLRRHPAQHRGRDADLQASVESRRDVLVTLTAEVARNYIELRSFQQRIEIARQNLATSNTAPG